MQYVDIQRTRFQDRLTVDVRIAPEAERVPVPRLLLQPLVENAIRLGGARRAGAERVEVTARLAGDRLELRVRDDGAGLPADGTAVREIEWLEASGKYVKVHAGRETHTMRETMLQLERVLDPERFLRISRSAIVNVDRIREMQPWFHGDYVVLLQGGDRVTSTRGYRNALARLLGRRDE